MARLGTVYSQKFLNPLLFITYSQLSRCQKTIIYGDVIVCKVERKKIKCNATLYKSVKGEPSIHSGNSN